MGLRMLFLRIVVGCIGLITQTELRLEARSLIGLSALWRRFTINDEAVAFIRYECRKQLTEVVIVIRAVKWLNEYFIICRNDRTR
jgi:hypothetical protein